MRVTTEEFIKRGGCRECYLEINRSRIDTKSFIERSSLIFDNFYDYSKTNYTKSENKVVITCPIHGDFSNEARHHLQGAGCYDCGSLKSGRYNPKGLKANPKVANLPAILYFVEFIGNNEHFYKIGITTKPDVNKRLRYDESKYYDLKLISSVNATLLRAKEQEIEFLKSFHNYKYIPKIKFGGYTECFKEEIYDVMFFNQS